MGTLAIVTERRWPSRPITDLLLDWSQGSTTALRRLMPLVVDELRRIARLHRGREARPSTLQATEIVNELYLRLNDRRQMRWRDRAHFFNFASRAIRRILVDQARARRRIKRGGDGADLSLDEAIGLPQPVDVDLVALDLALDRLASLDRRQSRLVELRFFGGLSTAEAGAVLGISAATVGREWSSARAWLARELRR